jgi:hypothetical protein
VIGAAKSGTTALHHYLKQHPEIFLSKVKEPRFFAFEGQKLDFCGPGDSQYQKQIFANFDDYCDLFETVRHEKAIGEISPLYLSQPGTARRIAKRLPNAKLIAILRHPAERAYSQFLMHRRDGNEPLKDFAKALEAEEQRQRDNWLPIWFYRQRGFYFQQLSSFYNHVPPDQIRVFLYDDFVKTPINIIRDICQFLGVNPDFSPDMSYRPNVSQMPRFRLVNKILLQPHPIKSALEKFLPLTFRDRVRNRLLEINSAQTAPLPEKIRRQLIADYEPDILQLQKLIGRDLSPWLE